jgi:protoheme IX farnesyltransferase
MGMYWLYMAWTGYKAVDDTVWARKLFVFSIFTITALSVMMSLDFRVPSELLLTYAP